VNVTLTPSHHTAGTKHKRRDRQFITGGENNLQFLETCLQTSSPILFLKTVYKNYLKNSVFKQIRLKSFYLKKKLKSFSWGKPRCIWAGPRLSRPPHSAQRPNSKPKQRSGRIRPLNPRSATASGPGRKRNRDGLTVSFPVIQSAPSSLSGHDALNFSELADN
jgi:hypothetical protein